MTETLKPDFPDNLHPISPDSDTPIQNIVWVYNTQDETDGSWIIMSKEEYDIWSREKMTNLSLSEE